MLDKRRTSSGTAARTIRRTAAALAVVAIAAIGAVPSPTRAPGSGNPLRVYVLVADGVTPGEVDVTRMPNLAALKATGTWYEQARAVFVAETLPNHVAMSTGVVPRRSGIVGNSAFDPRKPEAGDTQLELPSMLAADTTVTRLERDCDQDVSTATILSKTYLYNIFSGGAGHLQADFHWNAEPFYVPGSGHALDQLTMDQLRQWVFLQQPPTPQYAFVNLGDIDRSGHVDPTGNVANGEYPAGRRGAMASTDALIGTFVDELERRGWWEDTVLIVTSDHGMDYSTPDSYVDLERALVDAGLAVGLDPSSDDVGFSENGGAALVYVHRRQLLAQVRDVLTALDGVDRVIARTDGGLRRYGLDHPRSGDFVVLVDEGFRVASGSNGSSNPIPGNHGHAVTQRSVLLVAGGHRAVRDEPASVEGPVVYRPGMAPRPPQDAPGNLSVAPTVAELFGVQPPPGGFDAAPLSAAVPDATVAGRYCAAGLPARNGGRARNVADRDGSDGVATADDSDAEDARAPSLPATGGGIGAGLVMLTAGAGLLGMRRRREQP